MLEITPEHIAELDDTDLRTLIGRLCEAELASRGLPLSSVTWGGNQRAADGGLDVRVALPKASPAGDFVPRANTGFQVKCENMARAAILAEMRPSNVLRPAIAELADHDGAYIIVSSQGSTADAPLRNRREAMAEAVADLPPRAHLHLDFYDRTRIASWVRRHVGLIPWVRTSIGRALQGWQSYGAWAHDPRGADAEFLLDDTPRVQTGLKNDGAGLSVLTGIARLRGILREPGKVVRLVGLSGVGKTRLAQALFDARIPEAALDPALALYANISDDPDPQPTGMVSDLNAAGARVIVVIDNCTPELHRAVSEVCRQPGSTVSVITIEYDIREDEPEGTEVFELQPSSEALVEQLIRRRFPDLSPPNAHMVARFSGGNARIAIALAATIERHDSVSGLADRELFERLFQQRNAPNRELMRAAQACALVYSFQGEALTGDEAELPNLAAMIGLDAAALFGFVAELRGRDLVQARGVWRAVLPHAIANRLALTALEEIPFEVIERELINNGPTRLLKSFSRRLGYLEASPPAQTIVRRWLAPGGLLADVANLNELGVAMLVNIAPVAPEATLAAIERGFGSGEAPEASSMGRVTELLRSLAWDAALFERCAMLLAEIARTDNDARDALKRLFQLYLSGTHALIDLRAAVADRFLRSTDAGLRQIGLLAIGAMLEGAHFRAPYHFDFGARSRDYGFWPRHIDEVRAWYEAGFRLATRVIADGLPTAEELRRIVGKRFRGLWQAGLFDLLEEISRTLGEGGHWTEGWIGTRDTLRYDHAALAPEIANRLRRLEEFLRPRELIDKVRAVVLHEGFTVLDFDDVDFDRDDETVEGYQRTDQIARELGAMAATDEAALVELLPELFRSRDRALLFGRGLGEASFAPAALWRMITARFAEAPEDSGNPLLLMGFLAGVHARDPACTTMLLDAAVEDVSLGPLLPALQTAVPITADGVARLNRAITLNLAPAVAFRNLAGGRVVDDVSGGQLSGLLSRIAAKPGGLDPAMEILFMRLYSDASQHRPLDPDLAQAARDLLLARPFRHNDRDEGRLPFLVKSALSSPDGPDTARLLWRNFAAAVARHETNATEQQALLKGLFSTHPVALLDEIGTGDPDHIDAALRLVRNITQFGDNPIDCVPDDTLLIWCRGDPAARFPLAASIVTPVRGGTDGAAAQWTRAARALLDAAPDRVGVLERLLERFRPRGWSGSLAAILSARAELLNQLAEDADPNLAGHAMRAYENLQRAIAAMRQYETQHDQLRDERFE